MVCCRRRLAALLACVFLLPSAAAEASGRSWAQPQIKLVTSAGIFPATPGAFDPDGVLDQATLTQAIAALTATPPAAPGNPLAPVSVDQLDRSLVDALGLRDAASRFYGAAANAGLAPPRRFGSEVVARLLGLRVNHPAGQDALELQPQQPATVAEAAYSLAQILRFTPSADGTSRQVEQAQKESL